MFFKNKVYNILLTISLLFIPFSIKSYSDYIIASGENIGIKLNSDGVMIVGTYDVDGVDIVADSKLEVGDIIKEIDNVKVNNIDEMVDIIDSKTSDSINITYERDNEQKNTNLKLYRENDIIKTGLYVKDSITGIGTLTYIDPNTKIFGALGHEIIDSSTKNIFKSNNGSIFESNVIGITKSSAGNPGEKNATFDSSKISGTVNENTIKGIFGEYIENIDTNKLYKVATEDDIKLGSATIKTVLEGKNAKEYDINIIKINKTKDNVKNIIFEITDKELLNKTNGIIQGMSGSPIIQDNKIIGAVTHVIVEDPKKGFGIFITNMLEEGEN